MAREEYEQMQLDTRKELTKAVGSLTAETIGTVQTMIANCYEAPSAVRNRHEAYGIAAEHLAKVTGCVKSIKDDVATLLGTLPDPNYPAVEATSSIVNSTTAAAAALLVAAAEMKRTLDNLYQAENFSDGPTPLEQYATGTGEFEEAEPTQAEEADE